MIFQAFIFVLIIREYVTPAAVAAVACINHIDTRDHIIPIFNLFMIEKTTFP